MQPFLAEIPPQVHPATRTGPVEEILRESAFCRVEGLSFEYDVVEQPTLASALAVQYGAAWVLARLGDRRAAFEAEARRRLGWIDDLPRYRVRRRDVALFGFRGGRVTDLP